MQAPQSAARITRVSRPETADIRPVLIAGVDFTAAPSSLPVHGGSDLVSRQREPCP